MTKIPHYETQVSPQQVASPKLDSGLFTSAATGGRAVMEKMAEIKQKLYKVRPLGESTKAQTDYKIALDKVEEKAKNDQDTSEENKAKYSEEISVLQDQHLSTISDSPTRRQVAETFKVDGYNSSSRIAEGFHIKDLQNQEYQTIRSLSATEREFRKTPDKATRDYLRGKSIDLIKANKDSGAFDHIQAARAMEQLDTWDGGRAEYDAWTDPDLYFENKKNGDYEDVEADTLEKIDGYAEAEQAKRLRTKKIFTEQDQINTTRILYKQAREGKLTPAIIQEREDLGKMDMYGGITTEHAKMLRNAITIPKQSEAVRVTTYGQLNTEWTEHFDTKKNQFYSDSDMALKDLEKFRDKVLKAVGDRTIDEEDAENLMDDMAIAANSLANEQARDYVAETKRSWYDIFGQWERSHGDDIRNKRGEYLREYNKNMKNEENPMDENAAALAAVLTVTARVNEFYKAFEGVKEGETTVLPNGVSVKFTGQDQTTGDITFDEVK